MTFLTKSKFSQNFAQQEKKSYKKPLLAITCFAIILMIGLQFATQYIAHQFGYAAQIGKPMTFIKSYPIYPFWNSIRWFSQLSSEYGRNDWVTRLFGIAGYMIASMALLGAVAMRLIFRKDGMSAQESLHGTAHWATRREIIESGLLDKDGGENPDGAVVGGWLAGRDMRSMKVLRHNGPEHVLVFAPTRSGKGVGLVLPTLLGGWRGSTLVLDIKGENWALTAGYRKNLGQEVYHFNPADPLAAKLGTSVTFNPLEEIPLDYTPDPNNSKRLIRTRGEETASVQNLASIIADPMGKGLEDHWAKTGHALIVGTITHLLYVGRRNGFCPSLSDVSRELSKPGMGWKENIENWQRYPHIGHDEKGKPICHPVVATAAQEMLDRDPKEASSVLSTATSFLTLYRDPVIAENTQVSSFKIKDLMNREKPVNLYLIIKPTDLARLQPFIRLFVTQIINNLAAEMEFGGGRSVANYKHRLLLLLDEFPSLGKLPIFERALAFIAGYGIKAYLITQDLTQLYAAYGKDESIVSNCHVRISYSPNKVETAELLSKMSGTTTVVKQSVSESGKRTDIFHNQTSVSMQEYSRPLLTVDECMRLPGPRKNNNGDIEVPGDMLIFPSGFAPIYGKQKLYFMDEILSENSKIKAPELSDHAIDMQEKQKDVSAKKLALAVKEEEKMRAEREQMEREERNKQRQSQSVSIPPHKVSHQ